MKNFLALVVHVARSSAVSARGLGLSLHPHIAALRGAGQYLQMWIEGHNGIQQRAAKIWHTLEIFFVLYSSLPK